VSIELRKAAVKSAQTVLRPLAGFMLRAGISFREFTGLAKSAFVAAASSEFGSAGRPTTVSRVSLLTGISRKEVSRQREILAQGNDSIGTFENKTNDATRVLSGWHQDPDFVSNGEPKVLDAAQFDALCKRYCTDVPVSAARKELQRVGAVSETPEGHFRVKSRYYRPASYDPQWLVNAGGYLNDIANTINYNIDTPDDRPTRFLGRASEHRIDAASVAEFHEFLEREGQQFLETVDRWLTAHRAEDASGVATVRLGAGVFFIQEDEQGEAQQARGEL